MSTGRFLLVVLVSFSCTFFLRALPFLAFSGERKMPAWLDRLGHALPSAIMAVLVVYCVKDAFLEPRTMLLPTALAVAVVTVSYHWKHHTLLSIAAGTAVYMLLLHLF